MEKNYVEKELRTGPIYTDEEQKTNVDSKTVYLRLLIIGLIVLLRLGVVSIELYFQVHFFYKNQ